MFTLGRGRGVVKETEVNNKKNPEEGLKRQVKAGVGMIHLPELRVA